MNSLRTGMVAVICLAFGSAVWADEEKIPLDKLPAKVKEAIKAKFPDAELVSAEKDTEKGKVSYEVIIKNKGKELEVILTEDGKITALERVIDAKDLPKAVAEAFEKKYPKATIKKVEEVTKGEKVSYELEITVGDKKLEVTFDSEGKFLEEEDASKEKNEEKNEEKK